MKQFSRCLCHPSFLVPIRGSELSSAPCIRSHSFSSGHGDCRVWYWVSWGLFLQNAQKRPSMEVKMNSQRWINSVVLYVAHRWPQVKAFDLYLSRLYIDNQELSLKLLLIHLSPHLQPLGWRQINKRKQAHFCPVPYVAKNSSQMEKIFPEVFCCIICFK